MPFVTLTPSSHGLPSGWSASDLRLELTRAAERWNAVGRVCDAPLIHVSSPAALRLGVQDSTSIVVFRTGQWCHNERCGHTQTFPTQAMAMTSVYPSSAHAGAEGDIELNAITFLFAHYNDPPAADAALAQLTERIVVPLEPVLVHEIGHVLGLPDRCVDVGDSPLLGPSHARCRSGEQASVMFAPALNQQPNDLDARARCQLVAPPAGNSEQTSASEVAPAAIDRIDLGSAASALPACLALLACASLASISLLDRSRQRGTRPRGTAVEKRRCRLR